MDKRYTKLLRTLNENKDGQFVGRRVSRHLDKQPFPHDDGPHYSVHKESVEVNEKAVMVL